MSLDVGRPIPSTISSKPVLPEELSEIWDAFGVLNTTRQYGFGIAQPITLVELKAYVDLYGIVHDIDEFVLNIKHLDVIFLTKVKENGKHGQGQAEGDIGIGGGHDLEVGNTHQGS